jgi:hypothetical protein
MADHVATPSNPLVTLIEEEKLEETSFDVNISQRSCEEKSSKRVVHTQVDRLAWDRQLFFNPHALGIYLKFILIRAAMLERFEECQCEDDDVRFHCHTWDFDDGHYC